jgi:hypothetical protein
MGYGIAISQVRKALGPRKGRDRGGGFSFRIRWLVLAICPLVIALFNSLRIGIETDRKTGGSFIECAYAGLVEGFLQVGIWIGIFLGVAAIVLVILAKWYLLLSRLSGRKVQ